MSLTTDVEICVPPTPQTARRFWAKVDQLSNDGCWIWTANVHPSGYGVSYVDGRDRPARKVAWIWENGLIEQGFYLSPICKQDRCIRPSHMFVGRKNERPDGTKECSKCKTIQPVGNFGKCVRRGVEGRQAYCRSCAILVRKERWKDPHLRERDKATRQNWIAANPLPLHVQSRYGISGEEYANLLETQNGACAICLRAETRLKRDGQPRRLALDHCHTSGKVRALLCFDCNTGLGKFSDDPERLRAAASYLERHRQTG